MELIEQIEARLEQAITESNLDNPLIGVNLQLIEILNRLLSTLYGHSENKQE